MERVALDLMDRAARAALAARCGAWCATART